MHIFGVVRLRYSSIERRKGSQMLTASVNHEKKETKRITLTKQDVHELIAYCIPPIS